MTRRSTKRRAPLPAGAWRRFFAALIAFAFVLVGVPVLLVASSRVGLDASHPFPAIGSSAEIQAYFQRDLTPTEVAPIAMRVLLVVAWALWLAMVLSVLGAIAAARGSSLRSWLPQFALFAGLGRWIAAGLTAVSSLAPHFVSSAALASPRPFTVSSITPDQPVVVERPVAHGFARVQRGESVEIFADRVLGDAARWPEIWELNRDSAVAPDGAVWSAPWKLGAGWDLRLPADAVPAVPTGSGEPRAAKRIERSSAPSAWAQRDNLTVVDEYEVVEGDSFWAIAERFLPDGSPDRDVWEFTEALMRFNAPRLGYAHPAMLHPGDIVEVLATTSNAAAQQSDDAIDGPATTPQHTVVAGDSYWEIAEEALGDAAAPQAVIELTRTLIDVNSPRLGYADQRMIHPGDVVYLTDATTGQPPQPVSSSVAADVDAIAIDELPPPRPSQPTVTVAPTTTTPATSTTTSTTLPPPGPPAPPTATDAGNDPAPSSSSPIGIGQAALIATGVVALLAARRRARLRAAEPPARVPLPHPDAVATERALRRLDASDRLLRVDIALRAAAAELADGEARIVAVRCGTDGTVEVHLTAPAALSAPWHGAERCWTMPGDVPVDELAGRARVVGAPCVALAQIGIDGDGWDVLVDFEATGVLAIDAEPGVADAIVSALAIGLASSEFAEIAQLVGVGIDEAAFLGHRHAQVVPTVDEALELAATLIGTTAAAKRSTFSLRARHTSGEMWEPAVIFVVAGHAGELPGVTSPMSARGGLAIVVGAATEQASTTLRPDGDLWVLEPLGLRVRPIGVGRDELDGLVEVFGDAVEPEPDNGHVTTFDVVASTVDYGTVVVPVEPNGHRGPDDHDGHNGHHIGGAASLLHPQAEDPPAEYRDPPWSLMVRVLGGVEVVDGDLRPAKFERSKTLELVSWLVMHRATANRSAARTALWDLAVRDATFANVVSEARRTMARHVPPPEGDEWLRRTMTDELSLHDEVVADADLVRARFERARSTGGAEAMALLRPAVELVSELPFSGTGYLWPDAEGITSNLVLLATNVSAEYAKLALAAGDVDGVFWATGRGLRVLAGQEGLIALRMRAHAEAGDLSGVRLEWEAYERVLNADPWSDGEPAEKLVALRRELLSR
jgi:nucleoid-associated protein YgaU